MKRRDLVIGDPECSRIKAVLGYAKQESNWFHPEESDFLPADKYNYVALIPRGYKCVFTYTRDTKSEDIFRHLTVSVTGRGNFPREQALFQLAGLFGFKKPKKVGIMVDERNERVILVEKINKRDLQQQK